MIISIGIQFPLATDDNNNIDHFEWNGKCHDGKEKIRTWEDIKMLIIQRYYFHINIVLIQIGNLFLFFAHSIPTSNHFFSHFIFLRECWIYAIHHALYIWYRLCTIYNIINGNRFRLFSERNEWIRLFRRHWFWKKKNYILKCGSIFDIGLLILILNQTNHTDGDLNRRTK